MRPLAGALAALTVLAILSIGAFIAPFALVAIFAAVRCGGEGLTEGLIAGAGITLIAIGFLNLDYTAGWLIAGCALLVAGVAKHMIGATR